MPQRSISSHAKSKRRFPQVEDRAWIRYMCDSAISYQPLEFRKNGAWLPARVANLSAKGLGLALAAPLQPGAILSVLLEGTVSRFSRPLLVRVVRATERPGEGWHIGCTFAIPLGKEELQNLLPLAEVMPAATKHEQQAPASSKRRPATDKHDPFLQGSVNERRTFPRRQISVPISIAYGSAWEKTHEAQAIDISLGGFRLLTGHPFGRGTILRLRSIKAPARVPSVEVRVKSCTPQNSKWVVATQVLQQAPSELLFYFN
jgi:hypothetical protein